MIPQATTATPSCVGKSWNTFLSATRFASCGGSTLQTSKCFARNSTHDGLRLGDVSRRFRQAHSVQNQHEEQAARKSSVSRSLYEKASGCVLWIKVTAELKMGPYYWLGGAPGKPLPAIEDNFRATKGRRNKEGKRQDRPNHVNVPGSNFQLVENLARGLEAVLSDH